MSTEFNTPDSLTFKVGCNCIIQWFKQNKQKYMKNTTSFSSIKIQLNPLKMIKI